MFERKSGTWLRFARWSASTVASGFSSTKAKNSCSARL